MFSFNLAVTGRENLNVISSLIAIDNQIFDQNF